ncbi:MAG: ABC transporter substrate-binding protein [Planctomycetota bacterium]
MVLVAALALAAGCGETKTSDRTPGTPAGSQATPPKPAESAARPWETDPNLTKKAVDGPEVLIGLACPLSGNQKEYGVTIEGGVNLAVEQLNADGGISIQGGPKKKVRIVAADDEASPDKALLAAQSLIDNPGIAVVIGHFNSSCSLAAQEKYARAGMVEFSPGSTNPDLCKKSRWTFRNIFNDTIQGQYWAQYFKNTMQFDRVAVISAEDDYGEGLSKVFTAECARLGVKVVAQTTCDATTQDYKTLVKGLLDAKPQAIFIADTYARGAIIIKTARELGVGDDILLCGSDGCFDAGLIKNAGKDAEGCLITMPLDIESSDPAVQKFVASYRKLNGGDPDAWAAYSYDATLLIAQTIAKVGNDGKAVREALEQINSPAKAYHGVTGATYFDTNGDCQKPFTIGIVRNGQIVGARKKGK